MAWEAIDVPIAIKAHLQQKDIHSSHTGAGVHWECLAWVIREAVPLDPTEHLLHKATLPSQEDTAALYNIWEKKHKLSK